jgi:hypothetical protein
MISIANDLEAARDSTERVLSIPGPLPNFEFAGQPHTPQTTTFQAAKNSGLTDPDCQLSPHLHQENVIHYIQDTQIEKPKNTAFAPGKAVIFTGRKKYKVTLASRICRVLVHTHIECY